MRTERINPFGNFPGLVKAVLAFDHGQSARGVVQCIFLEGGRVITGCVTQMEPEPQLRLISGAPENKELLEPYLRELLKSGRQFVMRMDGMLSILWQISD